MEREKQSADRTLRFEQRLVTDDRELLLLFALDLEPRGLSAWRVRRTFLL